MGVLNEIIRNGILFLFRIGLKLEEKLQAQSNPMKYILQRSYYSFEADSLKMNAKVIMDDVVQIREGEDILNFWRTGTDLDGMGSMHIAGDKAYCYSVLKGIGIPVPRHTVLKSGDYRNAIEFKKKINREIVVKPARNTGDGVGVMVKPDSKFSIFLAVNIAGAYGTEIIVEELFEGTNYRLLYCKGRFLGASARLPATISGDGHSSIKKLIESSNRDRRKTGDIVPYVPSNRPVLYQIPITRKLRKAIKKQGLTLNSIPGKEVDVKLQDICHWLYGGQYLDVTDTISHEFVEVGRQAVKALGVKLAGVDLIAQNLRRADEGNYVINEVNATPALLIHYEVQNQDERRPVAREILKASFDL
jgi:D-alanine-D-alanine ligase-like ATP-grasp enzyme